MRRSFLCSKDESAVLLIFFYKFQPVYEKGFSSSPSVIVRVNVVLKRAVVGLICEFLMNQLDYGFFLGP